jgi:hypothetical protein
LVTNLRTWILAKNPVLCFCASDICLTVIPVLQGRDQRPPKHEQLVDVLDLRQSCLEALADYVLAESLEGGGQASINLRYNLERP